MKKNLLTLGLLAVLLAACASAPKSTIVLLDPNMENSLECKRVDIRHTPDGRMEVIAYVHNLENRRLQVQINCVFQDEKGTPSEGDDTPFRTLILTENAVETVQFSSFNDRAKLYTLRIREGR
jgi:uncharacterized protein YcfL